MSDNEFDPFQDFDGSNDSEENDVRDPLADVRKDDEEDDEFEWCREERPVLPAEDSGRSDEADREGETGTTNIEVRDTSLGTHHGQPIRASNTQMTRVVANTNATDDRRAGGPDVGNDTPDDILDTVPEGTETSLLETQERAKARQAEIEKTHFRSRDDLEERTRAAVEDMDLGGPDGTPLEDLKPTVPLGDLPPETQDEAARESVRIAEQTDAAWSVRRIQWELGDRLRAGEDMDRAVLHTVEEATPALPGDVVDIEDVGDVNYHRVDIEGEIIELWNPNPGTGIRHVGLIGDDTGTMKFTVWESALESGLTSTYEEPGFARKLTPALWGTLEEGDTVRFSWAKRSFHKGSVNIEIDRRAAVNVQERKSDGEGGESTRDDPDFFRSEDDEADWRTALSLEGEFDPNDGTGETLPRTEGEERTTGTAEAVIRHDIL